MPKGISEKAFESQVKHLAKLFGWRYYHTWRSIHSPAGFPDTVMVRPPRLIFAELKSEKGKLTPEQEAWIEDLKKCHILFDLDKQNTIKKVLSDLTHVPFKFENHGSEIIYHD